MYHASPLPTNPTPRLVNCAVLLKADHHVPDLTTNSMGFTCLCYLPLHPPHKTRSSPAPPPVRQFPELSEWIPEWMRWCYAPSHAPHLSMCCKTKTSIPFFKIFISAHLSPPPSHIAVQNNCLIFPSTNYRAKSLAQPPNHIEVLAIVFVRQFSKEKTSVATKRISFLVDNQKEKTFPKTWARLHRDSKRFHTKRSLN